MADAKEVTVYLGEIKQVVVVEPIEDPLRLVRTEHDEAEVPTPRRLAASSS